MDTFRQDKTSLALKTLYKSYGYREYKLSSFEEYSLYADNMDFLSGAETVTFSAGGKLMALRPDVTLSVAKSVAKEGETIKLFYDEKVYRPDSRGNITEIKQLGVEIIGEVDVVAKVEAAELMLSTLRTLGECVLDISHVAITEKALDFLALNGDDRKFALDCLAGKNTHDFLRFANGKIPENKARVFTDLMQLPASPKSAISALKGLQIPDTEEEIKELEDLVKYTGGAKEINIDFSIVGNPDYYNGLIFKGYVRGVPRAVLSGGRYDNLLKKFNKSSQAIGFALYLGELDAEAKPSNPDCIIEYNAASSNEALEKARALRAQGKKVLLKAANGGDLC